MEYLETKKQILELKLELVNIQIEKTECIRYQKYEKASDIRAKERELIAALEAQKQKILEELAIFGHSGFSAEETHAFIQILLEFTQDEYKRTYTNMKYVFMERIKIEYEDLINTRRQLHKENKFEEAYEVQKQIMIIGQYLLRQAL